LHVGARVAEWVGHGDAADGDGGLEGVVGVEVGRWVSRNRRGLGHAGYARSRAFEVVARGRSTRARCVELDAVAPVVAANDVVDELVACRHRRRDQLGHVAVGEPVVCRRAVVVPYRVVHGAIVPASVEGQRGPEVVVDQAAGDDVVVAAIDRDALPIVRPRPTADDLTLSGEVIKGDAMPLVVRVPRHGDVLPCVAVFVAKAGQRSVGHVQRLRRGVGAVQVHVQHASAGAFHVPELSGSRSSLRHVVADDLGESRVGAGQRSDHHNGIGDVRAGLRDLGHGSLVNAT